MIDRISSFEERYEELNQLLADPEVVADYTQVQRYAKEQSTIREVVELSREYRRLSDGIKDAREMAHGETDPEIVNMAREEQQTLQAALEITEENLKIALVPKDPNDDKNVIIEIRAGTGGDEAGLFASVLYRMYSRLAQRLNWKMDLIDLNSTGIGGIKEVTCLLYTSPSPRDRG